MFSSCLFRQLGHCPSGQDACHSAGINGPGSEELRSGWEVKGQGAQTASTKGEGRKARKTKKTGTDTLISNSAVVPPTYATSLLGIWKKIHGLSVHACVKGEKKKLRHEGI